MSGRSAWLLAVLVACGAAPAPAPGTAEATTELRGETPAVSAILGDGSDAVSGTPWPELVRDEQWDAAGRGLDALTDGHKSRPEIRYVRARVALARNEPAVALHLLEGLEGSLPLLTDD